MMALASVLLCFAVLHYIASIANAASDFCSDITYTTIDDIRRSTAYDTTTDLCDRGVIKDGSWYRFKSAAGDKMPESNPGTNHCGTFIPIWMKGNHPAILGETVSRDACAAVPFRRPRGCGVKFAIKVVNCGSFFLYQLKEPKYCNYAYCAGTKKISQADQLPSSVKLRILNITVTPGRLHKVNYLKCAVEGDPSPDVWWTKADGSYIRGREIRFRNNNRTFIIWGGVPKHVRTYYCHARNKFHYVNASFELKLIDVPSIDHISYNNHDRHVFPRRSSGVISVQLFIGQEDERVSCRSSGYPNVRVTWKRNGIEIVDYLNRSSNTRVYQKRYKRTLSGDSELHFEKLYCDDAGNYTCESSIDGYDYVDIRYFEVTVVPSPVFMTTVISNSTQLRSVTTTTPTQPCTLLPVTSTPVLTQSTGTISVHSTTTFASVAITPTQSSTLYLDGCYVTGKKDIYRGENITLTCHGNGHPYPQFTWYFQGQQLKTNTRVRIQEHKLDIFNATMNFDGWYTCVPFNEVRNVSCGIVVKVEEPVRIVNITASSNQLFDDVYIKCEVQGRPSPQVWWTRKTVPEFRREYNTLVIHKAKIQDIGTYSCHARNSLSYSNASFELNLIGIPFNYRYYRGATVQLYRGQRNFHFNCAALGYPNLRLTWKRKGIEILESLNSSQSTHVYQKKSSTPPRHASSQLYFKEVYCHDAGVYTCESSIEGYEYVDSDSVRVEVICNSTQAVPSTQIASTNIVAESTNFLAEVSMTTSVTANSTKLRSILVTTTYVTRSTVSSKSQRTILAQFTSMGTSSSKTPTQSVTTSLFSTKTRGNIPAQFTGMVSSDATTKAKPVTSSTVSSKSQSTILGQFTNTGTSSSKTPTQSVPLSPFSTKTRGKIPRQFTSMVSSDATTKAKPVTPSTVSSKFQSTILGQFTNTGISSSKTPTQSETPSLFSTETGGNITAQLTSMIVSDARKIIKSGIWKKFWSLA